MGRSDPSSHGVNFVSNFSRFMAAVAAVGLMASPVMAQRAGGHGGGGFHGGGGPRAYGGGYRGGYGGGWRGGYGYGYGYGNGFALGLFGGYALGAYPYYGYGSYYYDAPPVVASPSYYYGDPEEMDAAPFPDADAPPPVTGPAYAAPARPQQAPADQHCPLYWDEATGRYIPHCN
jgi:hypothetical protein